MKPDHRYRCEVRAILAMRKIDRNKALSYLQKVEEKRGKEEAQKLKDDAASQWQRGNRGEWGNWR